MFVLTGFWHGASWNFLIWGLFHGAFLAAEHAGFSNVLKRAWTPVRHLYVLFVVVTGWVFFRSETLTYALEYLRAMFSPHRLETTNFQFAQVLSTETLLAFALGLILIMPVYTRLRDQAAAKIANGNAWVVAVSYTHLTLPTICSV